ncbi:MAG TPA: diguanylate cyclase [Clostridiales bacterium]|nr:diguanylate cyclase [Clostridiales bacterium]
MRRYVLRRVLQAVPVLLGITMISFFIIHLAPGSPAALLVDPTADPASFEAMERALGLDRPLHVQYYRWVVRLLRGDLGRSFDDGRPVLERVVERIDLTFLLMAAAFLVSFCIGIPLGIVCAVRQYSRTDHVASAFAFVGLSLPNFWFALILMLLFTITLGWLPAQGIQTHGLGFNLWDRTRHLIMPVIVLGYGGALAGYFRYTRSSMLEVIRQDYVRTARSKGLAERVVIYRHALKNALLPLITLVGLALPGFFGGALVTEQVFALPGIGRMAWTAIMRRDYPTVMAINTIAATLVVAGNFLADLAYGLVDPRIKYD